MIDKKNKEIKNTKRLSERDGKEKTTQRHRGGNKTQISEVNVLYFCLSVFVIVFKLSSIIFSLTH